VSNCVIKKSEYRGGQGSNMGCSAIGKYVRKSRHQKFFTMFFFKFVVTGARDSQARYLSASSLHHHSLHYTGDLTFVFTVYTQITMALPLVCRLFLPCFSFLERDSSISHLFCGLASF
jgi:hypothetical protein